MRTRETASAHGAAAHDAPPGHLGSPRSKATTVRPQLTGGVARRLRRGARRSGGQRREKRNGCIKICLLNSSFFLTQTVTFQKNENWEMVRKWWVSRQIIRSKISKCRILGLKPSVFEINCHLGLTPSVFKKNFPSVDSAGRLRWSLPVAWPIRSRHFRPLRADPPEPPPASGDSAQIALRPRIWTSATTDPRLDRRGRPTENFF